MSYDILVTGGRHDGVSAWLRGFDLFGCQVRFEPDFDPITWDTWAPASIKVMSDRAFPGAAELVERGWLTANFEFRLSGVWLDAPSEVRERRVEYVQATLRRLRGHAVPDVLLGPHERELELLDVTDLEALRRFRTTEHAAAIERLADVEELQRGSRAALAKSGTDEWKPDVPSVCFTSGTVERVDLVGAVVSAAALALLTEGELHDVRGPVGRSYEALQINSDVVFQILEKVLTERS